MESKKEKKRGRHRHTEIKRKIAIIQADDWEHSAIEKEKKIY